MSEGDAAIPGVAAGSLLFPSVTLEIASPD